MNVTDQNTNEVYSAYVIDDGYTFNYIPGDTMHFVIDRTKTDGGDTNDTGLTIDMGYFYSESQPTDSSKQCWHYVNGNPTPW